MNKLKAPLATGKRDPKQQDFWHRNGGKHKQILHELMSGKTPEAVTVEMDLYPTTIPNLMRNAIFLDAIKEILNSRYFTLQLQKLQDHIKIYSMMMEEFKNRIKDASDDTIVKEFLKMAVQKVEKTEINAQFIKVLNQTINKGVKEGQISVDNVEDIKDFFSVEESALGLEAPNINEEPRPTDSTMDSGEEAKNEQTSTDRVQRSQVSVGLPPGPNQEDSSKEMHAGRTVIHDTPEDPAHG